MLAFGIEKPDNIWEPKEVDPWMIHAKLQSICHEPQQDVCIVLEHTQYLEVVIYNEEVFSSCGRFIIASDYYWSDEEEKCFERLVREENVAYDQSDIRGIFEKYSAKYPEWHLQFRNTKPLRMIDHIRNCLQPGSIKEILYKAGLDEFAAGLSFIDEYNLIGDSPTEIFSGLSMRTLRAINCPGGVTLISTEAKRAKMRFLQGRYSWLFEQWWNEAMCRYMEELLLSNRDYEEIVANFKKRYNKLHGLWASTQYASYMDSIRLRERVVDILGEKLCNQLDQYEIVTYGTIFSQGREYWDAKMEHSNDKRNMKNEYSDGTYSITYPKSIREYAREGACQQNCMMNYLDEYVNNTTNIMLMRKCECEDKSFVTVEIRDGVLVQAYLKQNNLPDEDVLTWLRQYATSRHFEWDFY